MFDLDEATRVNTARCKRWHGDFGERTGEWMGSDWSNAFQGESGEAGNIVKKLRRIELSTLGNRGDTESSLLQALADELADTFLYEVSEREGFPERMQIGYS